MPLSALGVARAARATGILCGTMTPSANAQFVTVGGGLLMTPRGADPVAELHAETPPFAEARGYLTASWTHESVKPTFITAIERPLLRKGQAFVGAGAGVLWVEASGYRAYPLLANSTVVPLRIPRTSFVLIASTLPSESFDWSLVLKVGVTALFVR